MNIFKITLKPILILCKLAGFINFIYILESDGYLIKSSHSKFYYSILEMTRMIILVLNTFNFNNSNYHILQLMQTCKFWLPIIAARLSEDWMIKLINGIIKFDKKMQLFPATLTLNQRSININYWNTNIILFFLYFISYEIYSLYLWPPHILSISSISTYLFRPPYYIDITVIISSCFYFKHFEYRFQTLNYICNRLSSGLITVPDEFTYSDIAVLVECIRLLHAELCDLLRIFSVSYGFILFFYFGLTYIHMLFDIFFMINVPLSKTNADNFENILRTLLPYIIFLQQFIFLVYTIVAASYVDDERKKITSYFRLYQISNLPVDIKQQIKMFMNQIFAFELKGFSANGFFNLNLKLIVPIIIMMLSGSSMLILMKNHPIMKYLVNDTMTFWANAAKNTP